MRSRSWPRTASIASGPMASVRTRPICSMKSAPGFGSRSFAFGSRSSRLRRSWNPITGRRDFSGEIAPCLRPWFGIALARLVERAADLHLHDLEPWRKQPLRFLIGLEHRLQQSVEALLCLKTEPHQALDVRQIRSQEGDQQWDRNWRLAGGAEANDVIQCRDGAIDFRPHPVRDFFAFLRRGGGEQGGR